MGSHKASEPAGATVVAIIALYDGARFIERALASVLAQTRAVDEFIVVDDGSRDNGAAIVEALAKVVPVRLLSKPNGGQSSARNLGVAQSRSRFIALLDQDDFWYPDHIASLLAPFAEPRTPALGWVYADLDVGDEDGTMRTPRFLQTRPARHPKTRLHDCVEGDMFVLPSASLIDRDAFEAVGGFDESLSGYEDDDLFGRLFEAGYGNVFVNRPLSLWRIYGSSTSSTPLMTRSRMVYARKLLARHAGRRFADGGSVTSLVARRFIPNLLGEAVRADRRGDMAGKASALDDLRTVILPSLSPIQRRLATIGLASLRIPGVLRILTARPTVAFTRSMLGKAQGRRHAA